MLRSFAVEWRAMNGRRWNQEAEDRVVALGDVLTRQMRNQPRAVTAPIDQAYTDALSSVRAANRMDALGAALGRARSPRHIQDLAGAAISVLDEYTVA